MPQEKKKWNTGYISTPQVTEKKGKWNTDYLSTEEKPFEQKITDALVKGTPVTENKNVLVPDFSKKPPRITDTTALSESTGRNKNVLGKDIPQPLLTYKTPRNPVDDLIAGKKIATDEDDAALEKFRTVYLPDGKHVLPDESKDVRLTNQAGEFDKEASKLFNEQRLKQKPANYKELKTFQKDLDKIEYLSNKFSKDGAVVTPQDERELQNLLNKRNTQVGIHNNLTYGELEDYKLFNAVKRIQSLKGKSEAEQDLHNADLLVAKGVMDGINVITGQDSDYFSVKSDVRKKESNDKIQQTFNEISQPKSTVGLVISGLTTTATLSPLFVLSFGVGGVGQATTFGAKLAGAVKGSIPVFAPGGVNRGLKKAQEEIAYLQSKGEDITVFDKVLSFTKHIGGETFKNVMEPVSEILLPGVNPAKTFLSNVLKKATLGVLYETGTEQISNVSGDLVDGTNTSILMSLIKQGKITPEAAQQFIVESIIALTYGSTVGGTEFWTGHLQDRVDPSTYKDLNQYINANKNQLEKNLNKALKDAALTPQDVDQIVLGEMNPNQPQQLTTTQESRRDVRQVQGLTQEDNLVARLFEQSQLNEPQKTENVFDLNKMLRQQTIEQNTLSNQQKLAEEQRLKNIETARAEKLQKKLREQEFSVYSDLRRQFRSAKRNKNTFDEKDLTGVIDEITIPDVKQKFETLYQNILEHNQRMRDRNILTLENLARKKYGTTSLRNLDEEQQKEVFDEYNYMRQQGITDFGQLENFVPKIRPKKVEEVVESGKEKTEMLTEGENKGIIPLSSPELPPVEVAKTGENVILPDLEEDSKNKIGIGTTELEEDSNFQNDLIPDPNPTYAQKEAGNYKKGHVKLDGFDVTIENLKGSERSGTDEDGNEWSVTMNNFYGYLRGTVGKDKDHIDVFLADDYQENSPVFIVNQTTPDGKFDEHKVMMGFTNAKDAEDAYVSNYEKGKANYSNIVEMPIDEFKEWSKDQNKTKKPAEKIYYRGINKSNEKESDKFYSVRKDVAGDFAIDKVGDIPRFEMIRESDLPKKIYETTNKDELADELGLFGKVDIYHTDFDKAVKNILQKQGYEGVRYSQGTDFDRGGQTEEIHIFGKSQPKPEKQPYEMSRVEYQKEVLVPERDAYYNKEMGKLGRNVPTKRMIYEAKKRSEKKLDQHRLSVQQAINEGKIESHPDYPELKKETKEVKPVIKPTKPSQQAQTLNEAVLDYMTKGGLVKPTSALPKSSLLAMGIPSNRISEKGINPEKIFETLAPKIWDTIYPKEVEQPSQSEMFEELLLKFNSKEARKQALKNLRETPEQFSKSDIKGFSREQKRLDDIILNEYIDVDGNLLYEKILNDSADIIERAKVDEARLLQYIKSQQKRDKVKTDEPDIFDDIFQAIDKGVITNERAEEIIERADPEELEESAENIKRKRESDSEIEVNEAIQEADEIINPPDKDELLSAKPPEFTNRIKKLQDQIDDEQQAMFPDGTKISELNNEIRKLKQQQAQEEARLGLEADVVKKEKFTIPKGFDIENTSLSELKVYEAQLKKLGTDKDQRLLDKISRRIESIESRGEQGTLFEPDQTSLFSAKSEAQVKSKAAEEALSNFHNDSTLLDDGTTLRFEQERKIYYYTKQEWLDKRYDPVESGFYKLKPGDKGYVEGQEIYRAEAWGGFIDRGNTGRDEVVFYGQTDLATGLEEYAHKFQKEVKRKNPELAEAIRVWEEEARAFAEEQGINIPLGEELFAKSFVAQSGFSLKEETLPIWKDIYDDTVEMLNESKSGEKVFNKYFKAVPAETTTTEKTEKGFGTEKTGRELLSAQPGKAPPDDQTQTPEFKKWFGNSKVVDESGNPLVVYHGTAQDFNTFTDKYGPIYFSNSPKFAAKYANGIKLDKEINYSNEVGPNLIPAYLAIKNPKVIDYDGGSDADLSAFDVPEAIEEGYDGVIAKNVDDGFGIHDQYIVFSPTQIKSATGNQGTFDPNNPNILLSAKPEPNPISTGSQIYQDLLKEMGDKADIYPVWVKRMVSEFGPEIRKNIRQTWRDAKSYEPATERRINPTLQSKPGSINPTVVQPKVKSDFTESDLKGVRRLREIGINLSNNMSYQIGKDVRTSLVRRLKPRALGIYFPGSGIVRVKNINDVSTLAHEIGHKLDFEIFDLNGKVKFDKLNKADGQVTRANGIKDPVRRDKMLDNLRKKFGNDIVDTLLERAIYRKELKDFTKSVGHYSNETVEGIAEFISRYVVEPETVQKLTPKFYQFFEELLEVNEGIKKALLSAREQVKEFNSQDPRQITESTIMREDENNNWLAGVHKFFSKDGFYYNVLDGTKPFRDLEKKLLQQNPYLPGNKNPLLQVLTLIGVDGKAKQYLENHPFVRENDDIKILTDQKSFFQIFEKMFKDGTLKSHEGYLTALRNMELYKNKKGSAATTTLEVAKKTIELYEEQLGKDYLTQLVKDLREYNNTLLQYYKDSGKISDEQLTEIKEMNQYYVPFKRFFSEWESTGQMPNVSKYVRDSAPSPVKAIKGSMREIVPPVGSLIKNTYDLIAAADRNTALKVIIESLNKIDKSLVQVIPARVIRHRQVINNKSGELEDRISLEYEKPENSEIITVWDNGKPTYYQIPKEYYDSFFAINEPVSRAIRVMSLPSRILQAGAVGYDPTFAVRNVARDQISSVFYSKYGYQPLDFFKGLFSAIKKEESYQKFLASGADQSFLTAMDKMLSKQYVAERTGRRAQTTWQKYKNNPLAILQDFNRATELSTRVGGFRKAYLKTGDVYKAMQEGREVSADYGVKGKSLNSISPLYPFFNARLQHLKLTAQAIRNNPKKVLAKGFLFITVPSLLNWLLNNGDDDDRKLYNELPEWRRYGFWNIRIPGTNSFLPIPKGFFGQLFGTTTEAMLDLVMQNDPESIESIAGELFTEVSPFSTGIDIVPQFGRPIVEQFANKQAYTGAPIVAERFKGIDPEEQYTETTSEFAKFLGRTVGISPLRIDAFIKSYTAGAGRGTLQITDEALELVGITEPTGEDLFSKLSKLPLTRAFVTETPLGTRGRSVEKFYEKLDEMEAINNTVNSFIRLNELEKAEEYLKDKDNDYKFYLRHQTDLNKFKDVLRAVRELKREIAQDKSIENKRDIINKIEMEVTDVAIKFEESYKNGTEFDLSNYLAVILQDKKSRDKITRGKREAFRKEFGKPSKTGNFDEDFEPGDNFDVNFDN